MERHGFVHDMLDVKVLILYIMARVAYPVDLQKIYELSYQDDGLSYFDVAEAVPQMIESGHLERVDGERYVITEKGREAGSVTEDSVAYPVMQRARAAVERYNRDVRRSSFVKTEIRRRFYRADEPERRGQRPFAAGADGTDAEAGAPSGGGVFPQCRDDLPPCDGSASLGGKGKLLKNTACCRARTGLSSKLIFATCMFRQKVV